MNKKERAKLREQEIENAIGTANQLNKNVRQYLGILGESGSFYGRQKIRLSRQDLEKYLEEKKRSVLALVTDYAVTWAWIRANMQTADYDEFRDQVMDRLTGNPDGSAREYREKREILDAFEKHFSEQGSQDGA